jgi:hypothetical protein
MIGAAETERTALAPTVPPSTVPVTSPARRVAGRVGSAGRLGVLTYQFRFLA